MKKIFLLILIVIFGVWPQMPCVAYQTCSIIFPYSTWKSVLYKKNKKEAIVQFVPVSQSLSSYTETVVFHSYKGNSRSSSLMLGYILRKERLHFPKMKRVYLKNKEDDSMAYWCNENQSCQIARVARSFDGIISMHYITKDVKAFEQNKNFWIQALANTKIYYSHYRWDRIMNRSATFDL